MPVTTPANTGGKTGKSLRTAVFVR